MDERRFVVFIVLALGIMLGSSALMHWLNPPPPRPAEQQAAAGKGLRETC